MTIKWLNDNKALKTAMWHIVSSQQMLAIITHRTDAKVNKILYFDIAEGIQQPSVPFLHFFYIYQIISCI